MRDDGDSDEKPEKESGSRGRALAAIVLLALLVAGALWTMAELRKSAAIQDCVMAGRRDCAPIESTKGS